jgi:hypothetical protein
MDLRMAGHGGVSHGGDGDQFWETRWTCALVNEKGWLRLDWVHNREAE